MIMMNDQIIRRFQLTGKTKSPTKNMELERQLIYQMNEEGYVFHADLSVSFKTSYDPDKDVYDFVMTAYGIHSGKDSRSMVIAGGVGYRY